MVLSYVYSSVAWTVDTEMKIMGKQASVLRDPGLLVCGGVAGVVARAAALPFDQGGPKGPAQALLRRGPQLGLLMGFYVSAASSLLPGKEADPFQKMCTTFLIGACSGFFMRVLTNPIGRLMDEMLRTGNGVVPTIRHLKSKTVLQFYYTAPPLWINALYFGTLFTIFEALRRFSERNGLLRLQSPADVQLVAGADGTVVVAAEENVWLRNYVMTAACHTILGGISAGVASTLCYPASAHTYLQTVIHDSAICRGLRPTLRKEVPLVAACFGTFSALSPFLAPHHGVRAGFGC